MFGVAKGKQLIFNVQLMTKRCLFFNCALFPRPVALSYSYQSQVGIIDKITTNQLVWS